MGGVMSNQVVKGSLTAMAKEYNVSIAETFIQADVVLLVDISSSMRTEDAVRNGERMSRYKAAVNELAKLQASLPGKLAVVSFNHDAYFCPTGVPPPPAGTTDLAHALEFIHIADDCDMRFILISDGEPDDAQDALRVARQFHNRIDTVFVGPEGGEGQSFLHRLASLHGGEFVRAERAHELASQVQQLLLTAGGTS
jgi:Mg-chelatase subunit ChlD